MCDASIYSAVAVDFREGSQARVIFRILKDSRVAFKQTTVISVGVKVVVLAVKSCCIQIRPNECGKDEKKCDFLEPKKEFLKN